MLSLHFLRGSFSPVTSPPVHMHLISLSLSSWTAKSFLHLCSSGSSASTDQFWKTHPLRARPKSQTEISSLPCPCLASTEVLLCPGQGHKLHLKVPHTALNCTTPFQLTMQHNNVLCFCSRLHIDVFEYWLFTSALSMLIFGWCTTDELFPLLHTENTTPKEAIPLVCCINKVKLWMTVLFLI